MKYLFQKIIFLLLITFVCCFLFSCSNNVEPSGKIKTNMEDITQSCTICDTNGIPKNTFNSGEEFIFKYSGTNITAQDLSYTSTNPLIGFSISRNDTIICSSTDFMVYTAEILEGTIEKDSSISNTWRGPNSIGRKLENNRIKLTPGNYIVKTNHSILFGNDRLSESNEVLFSIVCN